MANKCKECGCPSKKCNNHDDVHLHVEIENLKQKLVERENHIVQMETNFLNEANKFPSGEFVALREELLTWQDKYRRLYEAHRRVQRVNQGLEDKLLKLVDACETDKNTLTKDVATLSQKLAEANYTIKRLSQDNERYKDDVSLAIQFLQCKQSNFVVHKYDSLPPEVQVEVSSFMSNKRTSKPEIEKKSTYKSIKVPIPTFPPTAMVYSIPKSPNLERKSQIDSELVPDTPPSQAVDIVSAAIMAKVLEERQKDRAFAKHCDTCSCSTKKLSIFYDVKHHTIGTQTTTFDASLMSSSSLLIESNQRLVVKSANNSDINCIKRDEFHVAKVQPNNFLLDQVEVEKEKLEKISSQIQLHKPPNVTFFNVNESQKPKSPNNRLDAVKITQQNHHHLCNNRSSSNGKLGEESEVNGSAKNESTISSISSQTSSEINNVNVNLSPQLNKTGGPRYCSMRLKSGSNNVLLDDVVRNNSSSSAPILYKRNNTSNKLKQQNYQAQTHHQPADLIEIQSNTASEDVKNLSILSDAATVHSHHQQQQRVADWIQNNLGNNQISTATTTSSTENSQCDQLLSNNSSSNCNLLAKSANVTKKERKILNDEKDDTSSTISKDKYAEMEENVKRFLFGESEFMKTVEIGKLKYQNFKESADKAGESTS